jgi:hypothetical protein
MQRQLLAMLVVLVVVAISHSDGNFIGNTSDLDLGSD